MEAASAAGEADSPAAEAAAEAAASGRRPLRRTDLPRRAGSKRIIVKFLKRKRVVYNGHPVRGSFSRTKHAFIVKKEIPIEKLHIISNNCEVFAENPQILQ